MAILLPLLLIITNHLNSLAQPNTWVQKSDFGYDAADVSEPKARLGAVGFNIGSRGYIGTGYDANHNYKKDFWEYDPISNSWSQKANFGGTARFAAIGFSIGTKGYIGTGSTGSSQLKDFWEYDPITNSWIQKADFGGTTRYAAVGFSVGDKGYIGTGLTYNPGETYYKDFWEYNPTTNIWNRKADFGGIERRGAVAFSIDDKGYIGTGYNNFRYYKDFWEYDVVTNTWEQKTDFGGAARENAIGFSIGSKGYIGTGYGGIVARKDFWEYDPVLNVWTQKENYGGIVSSSATGFSINGKGYIGTGSDGSGYSKDFWEYDPLFNNWLQKAGFGGNARSSAVGFSIGNKGYIGTGQDDNYYYRKDFWKYDPVLNIWTQMADFNGTARSDAVGFSIGSKGYIGTGRDINGDNKDFWEYDPAQNIWTQKTDFGGIARSSAVGFSIGNKGYVGTGFNFNDYSYFKDFWEYDSLTNSWEQKTDFGGIARSNAVGFSIGNKGYIGIGGLLDFWEYDQLANSWTQKADFSGNARNQAVGFSIASKGYIGTGRDVNGDNKDFWEYDPLKNSWTQKLDFGAAARFDAVGFSIGNKGYIGTGLSYTAIFTFFKDFWEYTPDTDFCPSPTNLIISKISDTCARLNWSMPDASVDHIKVSYRKVGDTSWITDRKTSSENSKLICGLMPNTSYEWKVRTICADNKTDWIHGPDFITIGVLPLQLTSFSAALQKTNIVLNWQTSNEINTAYFNIQRSFNGANFTTIAKQNATGNGVTQQYLYTDVNVKALQRVKIFYRLQSVDKDGSSAYSNIVELRVSNSNDITFFIYPNPTKDKLHININYKSNEILSIRIVDMYGRQVYTERIMPATDNFNHIVDIQKLAKGIYTIQLTDEKEETKTKFVKE